MEGRGESRGGHAAGEGWAATAPQRLRNGSAATPQQAPSMPTRQEHAAAALPQSRRSAATAACQSMNGGRVLAGVDVFCLKQLREWRQHRIRGGWKENLLQSAQFDAEALPGAVLL